MPEELVSIRTDDGDVPAHLWRPAGGTGPGILLLQEIFGISDYLVRRAEDLAGLGYVVLAPEIFWRLGVAKVENGPDAIEEGMGLAQRVDWDAAVQDSVAALAHLRSLPEVTGGAGVVGFCFGGGLGFHLAAVADPDALVSYYGSSLPGLLELAPQVTAPSLHHFGLADSFLDQPTVERVREAVDTRPDVEFETYPGADHAFDNADIPLHHPEASALAWERTADFLARRLPRG